MEEEWMWKWRRARGIGRNFSIVRTEKEICLFYCEKEDWLYSTSVGTQWNILSLTIAAGLWPLSGQLVHAPASYFGSFNWAHPKSYSQQFLCSFTCHFGNFLPFPVTLFCHLGDFLPNLVALFGHINFTVHSLTSLPNSNFDEKKITEEEGQGKQFI